MQLGVGESDVPGADPDAVDLGCFGGQREDVGERRPLVAGRRDEGAGALFGQFQGVLDQLLLRSEVAHDQAGGGAQLGRDRAQGEGSESARPATTGSSGPGVTDDLPPAY